MKPRELWRRAVFQWPLKLAALALACLMWVFVSTADTSVGQRSVLVPINVEGIAPDLVPIGIPEVAEVALSGPSQRLDRLRPEAIEAVLDLSGLSGDFSAPVVVSPPQGVSLERVNPAEVFGILEQVATREVPVRVVYLGAAPPDVRLVSTADPATVAVRGRGARLERVVQVLVAVEVGSEESEAAPFAADTSGRPVDEVTVVPETVTVSTRTEELLVRREVPLRLLPLVVDGVSVLEVSHELVSVAGPPTRVAELEELVGAITLATPRPEPGRYTLAVDVATPDGVALLEDVTVDLHYDEQGAAP